MTTPRPEWVKDEWGTDYEELVASWGYDVLDWNVCGSYQGDYVVLLGDGERRGFIVIGYGSCSGCDALEGATPWSYEEDADWSEVVELSDQLTTEVMWEDSALALADRLEGLDEANHWWLLDDEVKAVRDKVVRNLLREAVDNAPA